VPEQARGRRQQLNAAVVASALTAVLTPPAAVAVADAVAPAGIRAVAVAQIRDEIARCGEADSCDHRILRGVDELVDVIRVESALQAHLLRARHARKRRRRAIGESPMSARNYFLWI